MSDYEMINSILGEVKPSRNLEGITDLVEGGYLDSFELMLLITRLSEAFEIEITFEEITPENFNSVQAIADMVKRLKNNH